MVVIEDHPSHAMVGKTDSLYLRHLPPFLHPKLGIDIFYNEEALGFLAIHYVRYERPLVLI